MKMFKRGIYCFVSLTILISTTTGLSHAKAVKIESSITNIEYNQDEICYGSWEREVLTQESYEELLVNSLGMSREDAKEKASLVFDELTSNTRSSSTEFVNYCRTVYPSDYCKRTKTGVRYCFTAEVSVGSNHTFKKIVDKWYELTQPSGCRYTHGSLTVSISSPYQANVHGRGTLKVLDATYAVILNTTVTA